MTRMPLLLLPGLLNTAALWRHQCDTLGDLADIAVADLTGAGSMATLARAVLAQAPPRFALAGLSMGGYVAQEIMRQAPARVDRLALIDTSPRPDTAEQSERRRGLIGLAEAGGFRDVVAQLVPNLIHPDRRGDAALIAAIAAMADAVGSAAFIRQQGAIMTRPDSRPSLAAITCPTVVICGREDGLTPLPLHREMADAIPGAKLVVIEEAGHLTPLERPHAISAVLRLWLQL